MNDIFKDTAKRTIEIIEESQRIDISEVNKSWDELELKIKTKKKAIKRALIVRFSIAASIAIFLIGNFIFHHIKTNDINSQSAISNIDYVHNDDIILYDNNVKVNIANNQVLKCTDLGILNTEETDNKETQPILNSDNYTLVVPKSKTAKIELSDGTLMNVNGGSKVTFPNVFKNNTREIFVEGEVLLDVMKNPDLPFIVKTHGFDVKVLGTVFDVKTHDKDGYVVLISGKVNISSNDFQVDLEPNYKAVINNGNIEKSVVDTDDYICWINNEIHLDDMLFSDLVKRLEEYYSIDINYSDEIRDLKLSGRLVLNDNFENTFEVLNLTYNLNNTFDNKVYYFTRK